jgi:hypothetical protein
MMQHANLLRWLTFLSIGLSIGSAQAAIIAVTPASDNLCQPDLDCSLADALAYAGSNGQDDVINIAAGIYSAAATFQVTNDAGFSLMIQGAGAGPTILDGGASHRVLDVGESGGGVIALRNLTIKNGKAPSGEWGGGIRNRASVLNLQRCVIAMNSADKGGGISSESGNLRLDESLVEGNSSSGDGGGIHVSGSGYFNIVGSLQGVHG